MGQTLQSSMREEGKVTVQGNFHQVEDLVKESDRSALKIKRGNGLTGGAQAQACEC